MLVQDYRDTPRQVGNPDVPQPINFFEEWKTVFEGVYKVQCEPFLKHVTQNKLFGWNLLEGAKGVQLAEKGIESWAKRKRIDLKRIAD